MLPRFAASLLQEFFLNNYSGNFDQRLKELWRDIEVEYDRLGTRTRLTGLTLNMFYNANDFPALSAKAAETYELVIVLGGMCAAFRRQGNIYDGIRCEACDAITEVMSIVRTGPDFLSEEQSTRLLSKMDEFMSAYNYLCQSNLAEDKRLFGFTIKLHYAWHTCHLAKWINPRLLWCYQWEDFMGRLILAAKACLASTPVGLLGNKVISNSLLVLELDLQDARASLELDL